MPETVTERRQTCRIDLTDPERRMFLRLMHRLLDDIRVERTSYRVHAEGDPLRGHLVKDGVDITDEINAQETHARRFLAMALMK